ncbi:alternative oxidase [Micractinium conductrix]|uniref:O-fucosyltransferase family protein n=1 Tax=Micractinium conductrix TaxID=554055 RepID=A0A2P6VHI0_9CHLO|nr:alternative oxidase [Micractinium conductrix]|eukprot:PSC73527.1 alternative oxidase [Micractinium conductrix]
MVAARRHGGRLSRVLRLLVLSLAAALAWKAASVAWQQEGADGGGAAARGRTYLSYTTIFGLSNQLYSHVNALALAYAMGVDGVIMPPAQARETFNHTLEELMSKPLMTPRPLGTLLDLRKMQAHWRRNYGIALQEARSVALTDAHPDADSEARFPWRPVLDSLRPVGERADCVDAGTLWVPKSPKFFPRFSSLLDALAAARGMVAAARRKHGVKPCIILRSEALFHAWPLVSTKGITTIAANGVFFSPEVEVAVGRIAGAIGQPFNGLHLRLEPDMGLKEEEMMPSFFKGMSVLRFNTSTPLYVASGLLSYDDTDSMERYTKMLKAEGLCSDLWVKERVLEKSELAGLHSEQLALVDLLVLSRSAKLVGTRDSSFSLLARELRLLQYGLGRRSVQLRLGAIKKLPAKLRDPYGFDPFMALMPEKPPAATAAAAAAG